MGQQAKKEYENDSTTDTTLNDHMFVQGLEKLTVRINAILHKISGVLLMGLMFFTAIDVVGRYFFNSPIKGTYELTGLFLALMIFYSLGSGQLKGNHIEIDFFTKKWSKRNQHILRSISFFILFILICLTSWQLVEYSIRMWIGGETSGDLGIPLFLFPLLAIIGAVAFALTLLLDSVHSILKVVTRDES